MMPELLLAAIMGAICAWLIFKRTNKLLEKKQKERMLEEIKNQKQKFIIDGKPYNLNKRITGEETDKVRVEKKKGPVKKVVKKKAPVKKVKKKKPAKRGRPRKT